jgi:hypothetical protein
MQQHLRPICRTIFKEVFGGQSELFGTARELRQTVIIPLCMSGAWNIYE